MSIPFGSLFVLEELGKCPQCTWFVSLDIDAGAAPVLAKGKLTVNGNTLEITSDPAPGKPRSFSPAPVRSTPGANEFVRLCGVPVAAGGTFTVHISSEQEAVGLVHHVEVLPK